MLGAGWSGFRTPEGKRYFLYSKTDQIGPEAHPDSYSTGIIMRAPYRGWSWPGEKFTTHIQLLPRWRMSGAILLLPLYAFMTWAGTILLRVSIRRSLDRTQKAYTK